MLDLRRPWSRVRRFCRARRAACCGHRIDEHQYFPSDAGDGCDGFGCKCRVGQASLLPERREA